MDRIEFVTCIRVMGEITQSNKILFLFETKVKEGNAYGRFAKPLEKNDIKKAHTLLKSGKYCDILKYMLESEKKLEQEIVS